MADQQETPPKKVGSLRDRIAAFEKAGAGGAAPASAPAPRPKPAGFATWKPRPPSPSSAPAEASQSSSSKPSAGLSASDAKDSIVKGGSLKDRMAALQGKGGFGGPPPPAPKPLLEKPKWKPPPAVVPPVDDDGDEDQPREERKLADIIKLPPPLVSPESSEEKGAVDDVERVPSAAEGEEAAEPDPEEEERNRRAAIAARMARLGGTRVGMAPPVFGKRPPPPPKKRSSVSEEASRTDPSKDSAASPKFPQTGQESREAPPGFDSPTVSSESIPESVSSPQLADIVRPSRRLSEAASLNSIESTETHADKPPPSSMPVPSVPRRAAPPRKKPARPIAPVPEPKAEPEIPSTSIGIASPEHDDTPAHPSEITKPIKDAELIINPPLAQSTIESEPSDKEDMQDASLPPVPSASANETKPQPPLSTEPAKDKLIPTDTPAGERYKLLEEDIEGPVKNEEKEEEKEEAKVDEETRRRQGADRITKIGGVNPFAVPPLPQKQSSFSVDSEELIHPPSALVPHEPPSPETPQQGETRESKTEVTPNQVYAGVAPLATTFGHENESARSPSSAAGGPQSFQAKETDLGGGETEDDDDSDYSEEDKKLSDPSKDADLSLYMRGEKVHEFAIENEDIASHSNTIPSAPRAHHRGVSVPTAEAVHEETDSDYDDEEMARSQILVPPPDFTDKGKREVQDQSAGTGTNPDDWNPLAAQHFTSRSDFDAEPWRSFASRPPGNDAEGSSSGSEEEEAFPISSTGRPPLPIQQLAHVRHGAPSFDPPPPPFTRPVVPTTRGLPPRQSVYKPDLNSLPLRGSTSQTSLQVPTSAEIFDDDEGDPIDPSFHSPSRRASTILPSSTPITPPECVNESSAIPYQDSLQHEVASEEDQEAIRRRTIAERMAKLGGIKFGAAPPVPGHSSRQAPPVHQEEEERQQTAEEPTEPDEEEEERARKARIATKMAGMGGMRIGMMPTAFPIRKSHILTEESTALAASPHRAQENETEKEESTSDDGIKVEAEESDLEEVNYEDAEEEAPPPPIPSRTARSAHRQSSDFVSFPPLPSSPPTRPPVPAGLPMRRPSTHVAVVSQRRTSGDSGFGAPPQRKASGSKPQSEYVMVEEPRDFDSQETPPPPPQRPAQRTSVPPPTRSPPLEAQDSISSQWELPVIPTSNLEFGNEDLSMSWTEAESPSASHRQPPSNALQTSTSANDVPLSSDELIAIWGRVGVQICEAATALFERSRKGLVGDGTFPGFIRAVISEVPNALLTDDWGYVVYKQLGASVQKRASDIMPGDLVELHDAKFKGHKGLQAYHQNVGADEPVVGVVSEFEPKKSKIRVFQANQHVGQQTVEAVSYRLEDLKSGSIKIYRVLEA